MESKLLYHTLYMLIGVFISAVAQVLLKKSAMRERKSFIFEYLNPGVILAYIIFIIATFLSILAYRVLPLSMGGILESTSYIYVFIFGIIFFKEKVTIYRLSGLVSIIIGIIIFSISG